MSISLSICSTSLAPGLCKLEDATYQRNQSLRMIHNLHAPPQAKSNKCVLNAFAEGDGGASESDAGVHTSRCGCVRGNERMWNVGRVWTALRVKTWDDGNVLNDGAHFAERRKHDLDL